MILFFKTTCTLQEGESQPSSFAQRHLHLAVTLYYKLLDAIMRDEERKNPDFGSLQVRQLLSQM